MRGFGGVVALVLWTRLFCLPWLLAAALLIDTTSLGRIAAVRITRRGGGPSMPHVVEACSILLVCLLLSSRLFLPLSHPLGADRRGAVIHALSRGLRRSRRRSRSTLGGSLWRGFRVVSISWRRRLVLRVSRLGRRHPVIMATTTVSSARAAVRSERCHAVRRGGVGSVCVA